MKDIYTGKYLFGDRVIVDAGFYQGSMGFVIECTQSGDYWKDGKKFEEYKYILSLDHDTNSGWIPEKHLSPAPPR